MNVTFVLLTGVLPNNTELLTVQRAVVALIPPQVVPELLANVQWEI